MTGVWFWDPINALVKKEKFHHSFFEFEEGFFDSWNIELTFICLPPCVTGFLGDIKTTSPNHLENKHEHSIRWKLMSFIYSLCSKQFINTLPLRNHLNTLSPHNLCVIMLWFKFILGLVFFELVLILILLAIVSDYGHEYMTKENNNWNSFKNFAPKLNLNHNIYITRALKTKKSIFFSDVSTLSYQLECV